jgi:hypothetical protein
MSALPPIAAAAVSRGRVRFVPEADIRPRLFDHLVGAGEQCGGNIEADCFGSLQVDDEFEFGGSLDGEIAGLFPFENTADIGADLAIRSPAPISPHPPNPEVGVVILSLRLWRAMGRRSGLRSKILSCGQCLFTPLGPNHLIVNSVQQACSVSHNEFANSTISRIQNAAMATRCGGVVPSPQIPPDLHLPFPQLYAPK